MKRIIAILSVAALFSSCHFSAGYMDKTLTGKKLYSLRLQIDNHKPSIIESEFDFQTDSTYAGQVTLYASADILLKQGDTRINPLNPKSLIPYSYKDYVLTFQIPNVPAYKSTLFKAAEDAITDSEGNMFYSSSIAEQLNSPVTKARLAKLVEKIPQAPAGATDTLMALLNGPRDKNGKIQ
ncbi:hypothetical protein [Chitinophaga sp. Cy-1792]|uniref:hypothetical protein n=1 Tax=Chitinophaga sp. Cy-1792 TaxID=2608339 RepID=UPI00141D9DDC|nr:hypothetical protein [Chitinophaga sp. Cy-1792]NIG56294.1 hypothetical protein [Chitinophaga sp. Cy-1792]